MLRNPPISSCRGIVLLIASILLLLPQLVTAQEEPSVSASLSQESLHLGQTAILTITVNGARSAAVEIPEHDDLVFHRRGQSSRIQIVNGSYTASVIIKYLVEPLHEGKFTIPPMVIAAAGKSLTTEPLSLEITAAGLSSGKDGGLSQEENVNNGENPAFITLTDLPESAFTGEILPVEIKAYFLEGIRAEIDKLPEISGSSFVLSPLENQPVQSREVYRGKTYTVLSWQSAVAAVKEGVHKLNLGLDATLLVPRRESRSLFNNDPFLNDDFFQGFFGGVEKKRISLKNTSPSLTIKPLPEQGKPADFSGAIGDFNFTAKASPTEIAVGDPVTLTLTIAGKGNFDRVSAPSFPVGKNWKTYSPSSHFTGKNSYQGEKIFEQAVVAASGSPQSIPSLSFSYFDPEKQVYITRTTKPLPLNIAGGAENTAQPEQVTKTGETGPQQPIETKTSAEPLPLPQHLTTGRFIQDIKPVFAKGWFIFLAAMSTLVLVAVIFLTLRRKHLAKNRDAVRRHQVKKELQAKLNLAEKALQNSNGQLFLGTCRELIQTQLAYSWRMNPSAITLYDLQQKLPADSPYIRIFSAAQQSSYGGSDISSEKMQELYSLLQACLKEIV